MANLSSITLPNNSTYNLKDNSGEKSNHNHYESDTVPIQSKTYTGGYYATEANQAASTFYFMSIRPTDWNLPWRVHYKVHTWVPGQSAYESFTDSLFTGRTDSISYANWNELNTAAHYYLSYMTLKSAGYTAGYGHAVAMSTLYAGNYTSSSYKRNFEVDVYYTENCTVTLLDAPVLQSSWTGYNTTNYNTVVNANGASRGLQETGDNNDPNYYHRIYSGRFITKTVLYRYQLLLTIDNDTLLPMNTVNNSVDTTKALTTESFDPFGPIYYYNSTNTYNANAVIAADGAVYDNMRFDLRYATNVGQTLTAYKLVYLVMVPDSNGRTVKLDSNPITQTIPTTDDGKLYRLLGMAYNSYQIEMFLDKPIFYYKDGLFRVYEKYSQNLVTSINSTNTHLQIPSAKAVYDVVGNIENVLTILLEGTS